VSVYPNPYLTSFEGHDGVRTTYFDLGYEARRNAARSSLSMSRTAASGL